MSYTLNHYGFEHPFFFGNKEDTPEIAVFDQVMKRCGYIKARRQQ